MYIITSKHFFRKGLSYLANIPPIKLFIRNEVILPFYHNISDFDIIGTEELYKTKKPSSFEKEIDFLLKHYNPLSIDEFNRIIISKEKITKPYCLLSFDDGLKSCSDIIAPILIRKGVPAIFFINTGFIDNKDIFYRYKAALLKKHIIENIKSSKDTHSYLSVLYQIKYNNRNFLDKIARETEFDFTNFLEINNPYLNSKQVKYLLQNSFTIGSHSVDHPNFGEISFEEQKKQVIDSFNFLKTEFNIKYKYFSFPFTDYNVKKDFFEFLKDENVQLSFGTAGLKRDDNINNIERIAMDRPDSKRINKILKTEYLSRLAREIVDKNYIKRI